MGIQPRRRRRRLPSLDKAYQLFIYRTRNIVLTDGQPSTGDDEDNGLFDTAKNIYGVFDDSRFRDTSYTMTVYNDPAIPYNNNYNGYYEGMDVIIRLLSITKQNITI